MPTIRLDPSTTTLQVCVFAHLFTGKERDSESGLDYFGARYYSSSMGRFSSPEPGWLLQADPSNPQSWNQYAYAMNNPLSNVDPDGYDCVYLNDAGNGVEENDQHSNSDECGKNSGYWVDGTTTHVNLYSNSNDVGLTGKTTSTDSQGNTTTTPTDAFYTSATSAAAQYLLPLWGYGPQTGTINMSKFYKNRPTHFFSAQNPVDVAIHCAGKAGGGAALDVSGIGLLNDTVDAAMSGSLKPLFNSGDRLNDAGMRST